MYKANFDLTLENNTGLRHDVLLSRQFNIPTFSDIPDEELASYTDVDGTIVEFHIGDEVRIVQPLSSTGYVFYKLYNIDNGAYNWIQIG